MTIKALIRITDGGCSMMEWATLPGLGHYVPIPNKHGMPSLAKVRDIVWTSSAQEERYIGGSTDLDHEWEVVLFCDQVHNIDTSDGGFEMPVLTSIWDAPKSGEAKSEPKEPVPLSISKKDQDDLLEHAVEMTKTLSKVAFANTEQLEALSASRRVAEESIAALEILTAGRVEIERVKSYKELISDLWIACYRSKED